MERKEIGVRKEVKERGALTSLPSEPSGGILVLLRLLIYLPER